MGSKMNSGDKTRLGDLELAREYARRLRDRLGENLVSVTLFGSRARGDARDGSDFDLIVRVKKRSGDVRDIITDVDVEMMNEFEELFIGMLYDEKEWEFAAKFPFGWNIASEGVAL